MPREWVQDEEDGPYITCLNISCPSNGGLVRTGNSHNAFKFTTRELQIFVFGLMVATLPWFIMFALAFSRSCR